jgi:hypothetical protein
MNAIGNFSQGNIGAGAMDLLGVFGNIGQLGRSCFAGDMLLDAEHGKKRADAIRVGDRLWSRPESNPEGTLELKEVEEVFESASPIWNVHLAGQVIRTSPEHPFWVEGRGWIPAVMLEIGDCLTTRDRRLVPVDGVADSGAVETVYNWRVAEYHTYFVGSEEWGFSVWAHNAECVLFHGSRDGIRGRGLSLEEAAAARRPTHVSGPGVYFTDDAARAATQYATPRGEVARVVIPDGLASAMRQTDRYGRIEYVARTPEQIAAVNRQLQILPQRAAIRAWVLGG